MNETASSQLKARSRVVRLGCVSYLNAKPLIQGLESGDDLIVSFDVPSRLLEDLETGRVDIALCPVIDYFRSAAPLEIVPVGGIGSDARTLTVRLFSRVPITQITEVHADTDSHTSVVLLQVLLAEQFGIRPRLVDYHARQQAANRDMSGLIARPDAMLLIGDKVVTDSPLAVEYPHQLDLGEAWRALTGKPFVFAIWMARSGANLGQTPELLTRTRLDNARRIDEIARTCAGKHGWPIHLARQYLGELLRYDIGAAQLQAIELFAGKAHALGLIGPPRPLRVRRS